MYKSLLQVGAVATLSLSLTTACVPLIFGGVVTAGYLTAQERGAKQAVLDTKLKAHIKDRLTSKDYRLLTAVEVAVLKGDVLLTGVVRTSESSTLVEKIVREVPGVGRVYNELYTDGIYPSTRYAEDSYIATQVRGRMLTAKDIFSINYMFKVVNGTAYVLGVSETQSEMERVIHIVRTTKGVKRVVNYIQVYQRGAPYQTEAPEANPLED